MRTFTNDFWTFLPETKGFAKHFFSPEGCAACWNKFQRVALLRTAAKTDGRRLPADFGCPHSLYQVAVSAAAIASILSSF